MNIKRFRRVQTLSSILLFVGVFFLCWYVTKFDLKKIQLSHWGIEEKLGWIWNSCIAVLSISIFINVYFFIKHHTRLFEIYTKSIILFFLSTSIFLFITGVVDMHNQLHTITAYLYFISYPLAVFSFAHLNRNSLQYKEWLNHTIFSVIMVSLPLFTLNMFPGMAITEIIHTVIVILWNIWISTLDNGE